jgi:hypothetical protein
MLGAAKMLGGAFKFMEIAGPEMQIIMIIMCRIFLQHPAPRFELRIGMFFEAMVDEPCISDETFPKHIFVQSLMCQEILYKPIHLRDDLAHRKVVILFLAVHGGKQFFFFQLFGLEQRFMGFYQAEEFCHVIALVMVG